MPKPKSAKLSPFKNKNIKLVALVVAVVLVTLIGVKLLNGSFAATPTTHTGYFNYTSVLNLNQGNFTSQDAVPGIGSQYVADVSPGGNIAFNYFPGKVTIQAICYHARVYNSPKAAVQVNSAEVVFVGQGNSKTVTLPADSKYRQVCVAAGSAAQLPYNVMNKSNSAFVLVYQAVAYF